MGIQDRDYMRRPLQSPTMIDRLRRHLSNWRFWLATVAAVVTVASAALWLYRDTRSLVGSFGPDEGSLRVNINAATQEELETVPGIGPTRAAQIVAGRPYATVDDLAKLDGIGPHQVENLRPFVKTEGATEKL